MTTPTAQPILDAVTGQPVGVTRKVRHVLLGTADADVWLTTTAAVVLADALRAAADLGADAQDDDA